MQTSTNNLNKTQAVLQISVLFSCWEKGHLLFFNLFWILSLDILFFCLFWILSFYIFIFLLVLDMVLVHLYFSTCFGYCPCTSLFFYWFWILSLYILFFYWFWIMSLYIFIFLLVLDIVLVHLYFSTG